MAPTSPEPAIATTKRKFHKLLDNIAASTSTSSLASTLRESNASTASLGADPATPPPKRSRVSDVGAEMEQRRTVSGDKIKALQEKLLASRKGIGRSTIGTVRVVNGRATPATPSTPRKAPNFQPYSQDQFLGRLKTFADVKKWSSKPDAINEVAWAKRGWVCDVWNTVACKGGCEKRVVVALRPKRKDADGKDIEMSEDLAVDVEEGLVERYATLIVDGHGEECLWRRKGCEDDIYHIPIPNRAKSSAETLERYRSFKSMAADIPLLENIMYPDPPVSEVLSRIPSTFFNPPGSASVEPPPSSPPDITAFAFALFGWTGTFEAKIALATCHHCFQRIGLWLYKDDRLKEMSTKLNISIESLRLNLLESHREHCPWKNSQTQRNPKDGPIKDMAAWQTLEFLLMARRKTVEDKAVSAVVDNADAETYRGSVDTYRSTRPSTTAGEKSKDGDTLNEKWKKFKAKLKRSTSRKSLKSVKSAKSVKSIGDKDKENQKATES